MTPSSDAPGSPLPPPSRPKPRRRVRRRFRLLLAATLLVCLLVSPQPWQAALRLYLTWQADRRGWELTIGGMEGGLLDATVLHDVHCRRRAPWPIDGSGTQLRVARAEFVPAWRVPYFQPPAASWLARLTLDGVDAQLSIPAPAADKDRPAPPRAMTAAGLLPAAWLDALPWLERDAVPADMELIHANVRVQRGPFSFEAIGARLTAYHDGPGQFFARELTVRGPGYENTLTDRHGLTFWKQPDRELTLANLSLNRWVNLTSITLDFSRVRRHKLDWDASLTALGGDIHSQGKATFARGRVALDVGGSLQSVGVRQMARLLGIGGQTDGNIEQGTFSFRGDPERWTEATFSLSAQAADFRWRERAWQRLELAAVVVNRRAQVRKLELRQSRNSLSFSGECALPPADPAADAAWWQEGFSGSIDAKLDDLGALARLLGPGLPEVDGRMSVNGRLRSLAPGAGFEGYLNVEGSGLKIRGAPLDYLRSTLLFKGGELQVADLQATRAADYFTGKGTLRIVGAPRYQAEMRAAVGDLSVYHPAYAGVLSPEPLRGALRLDWSGDGGPGAHSGAFRGSVDRFITKAGPAAFYRPLSLEAEGTYSPTSLSFRRLALQGGEGGNRRDSLRLEGALPWTQDAAAFAAGRWFDPDRPLKLHAEAADAPLDLLAAVLAPGTLREVSGLASGALDATGTGRAPWISGKLGLRHASAAWINGADSSLAEVTVDARIEDSVLHLDLCRGQRGGDTYRLEGAVDLHDPANPSFDLTVQSDRVTDAVNDDSLRADAAVALTVRGPAQGGTVSGEVRLLDGKLGGILELVAADPDQATLPPQPLLPLDRWLPPALLDRRLDLHVTADKLALAIVYDSGEAAADFHVTGTGREPLLAGVAEFRARALELPGRRMNVIGGGLYFTAGQADDPRVDLTAVDGGRKDSYSDMIELRLEAFCYGTARDPQLILRAEPGADERLAEAMKFREIHSGRGERGARYGTKYFPPFSRTLEDDVSLWGAVPPLARFQPRWAQEALLLPEAEFELPETPLVLRLRWEPLAPAAGK